MSIYPGTSKKFVTSEFLHECKVHDVDNKKLSNTHKISAVDFRTCIL